MWSSVSYIEAEIKGSGTLCIALYVIRLHDKHICDFLKNISLDFFQFLLIKLYIQFMINISPLHPQFLISWCWHIDWSSAACSSYFTFICFCPFFFLFIFIYFSIYFFFSSFLFIYHSLFKIGWHWRIDCSLASCSSIFLLKPFTADTIIWQYKYAKMDYA